ncbi:MAG: hypothetical protein IAE97_10525 [Chthoniobacterales bacterium]|nr:hypothetical protein [Chthoniobacterales bacterium]
MIAQQNTVIRLDEIATPEIRNLAKQVRDIVVEADAYGAGVAKVIAHRQDLEQRALAATANAQNFPGMDTMRALAAIRVETLALDASPVRYWTRDELFDGPIKRRHPEMRQTANQLCQAVVDLLHPMRSASEAEDAASAEALGIEKVVSVRTSSLVALIDVAMLGTWAAAVSVTSRILDGDEASERAVPEVFR